MASCSLYLVKVYMLLLINYLKAARLEEKELSSPTSTLSFSFLLIFLIVFIQYV